MQPATVNPSPVLHALRICGFAAADRLANYLRQSVDAVESSLRASESEGLVRYRHGRLSGWLLTAAGLEVHDDHIVAVLRDTSWQQPVLAGYGEFLDRNRELKQICTDWQLKQHPGRSAPNDHSDADYDRKVIDDLAALHERAGSMFDHLMQALDRFAAYPLRLEDALARLRGGDGRAFATPMSASYHCIWMELHQDLLVTLGRQRDDADRH
jgi:hypothetical protein